MENLEKYRKEIDRIDEEIIKLLDKRLKVSLKIGDYKRKRKLKIYDKKREIEVFDKLERLAVQHKLDETFINKVFNVIVRNSRRSQAGDE